MSIHQLVHRCNNTEINGYQLVVSHKFSEVDMNIDKLSYYITVNGDKIFYDDSDTCAVYHPELISTFMENDRYISIYKIHPLDKLTQNTSNEVKINILLPFDHYLTIFDLSIQNLQNLQNQRS